MLGMELASQDDRFVAVNLVQPEDYPASLENYDLQMQMLDFLHPLYPKAHITLHAGELVPGLVKPEDLRFHIRQAVLTGHAERIGHGVDIVHEDDSADLLNTLAERHTLIEVPLTSNEQILQVSGPDHPFPLYRRHGVPTALATDDPGVSRGDITEEYQKATTRYDLGYRDLKELARNSLEYGFLPGRSLWRDRDGFGRRRSARATRSAAPTRARAARPCWRPAPRPSRSGSRSASSGTSRRRSCSAEPDRRTPGH